VVIVLPAPVASNVTNAPVVNISAFVKLPPIFTLFAAAATVPFVIVRLPSTSNAS